MPSYLVETYLACGRHREQAAREQRARSAVDRSIHVLEDELCFFVFDAPSGRDAALVAQRADLEPICVLEAVLSRKERK